MERHTYKIIPLAEISREFPFVARYRLSDPLLWGSVARKGVLQPIVVTQERQILSGHKRFLAAGAAGLQEIPAFEISGAKNPADFYWLALFSNWKQVMSELDRAWAIQRAISDFKIDEKNVIEEILPALGLEPQRHFLEEYCETAALAPPVLEAIQDGKLPFRGARVLCRFSKSDQADFAGLIAARAALTSNQLLKTGDCLFDLLKLKNVSLAVFLKSSGLGDVLELSPDRRQKGEKFCAALRALRFPGLVQKEKEFASLAEKIEAGHEFSLEAPSFFEGEGLTLRAKLTNPEALEQLASVLERKRKLFNSLFDIML